MDDKQLHILALKFCDQCELTTDQSQDNAIFLRMFLFRFLGFVKREQAIGIVPARVHTSYCGLHTEHEGHCSANSRNVVQINKKGRQ